MNIYVYRSHYDRDAWGEELVRTFAGIDPARAALKEDVEKFFGMPWGDIPARAGFSEDDSFGNDHVSYDDGNGTHFWTVERHELEGAPLRIDLPTELGTLRAEVSGYTGEGYPGFYLSVIREGHAEETLLLAEVKAARHCESGEAEFHLRPFINKGKGMRDEDGNPVPGRISPEAPTDDFVLTGRDFEQKE